MFEQILFWLIAIGAVATSAMVVLPRTGRNPLYGALLLIVSFFFMAGLYVLLLAHTMAILQILVYAGAIMVLFMFVIMLLNLSPEELGTEKKAPIAIVGVLATIVVFAVGARAAMGVADEVAAPAAKALGESGFGNVETIGDLIFRGALFPFELTAILLLVAIVGAVVLAKRTL